MEFEGKSLKKLSKRCDKCVKLWKKYMESVACRLHGWRSFPFWYNQELFSAPSLHSYTYLQVLLKKL